jgi:hypothetical protein
MWLANNINVETDHPSGRSGQNRRLTATIVNMEVR